jgi:hypothetical protein
MGPASLRSQISRQASNGVRPSGTKLTDLLADAGKIMIGFVLMRLQKAYAGPCLLCPGVDLI